MKLTILADENIPAVEHYLGHLGRIERVNGRTLGHSQVAKADVLLVRSVTRVDAKLLADSPVRFVGTATSGIDHIDREYLAERGIAFAHAPGANANSVVEYVLSAVAAMNDTLERLLGGALLGIVGYGHVGRALAARLDALGIGYRIFDPWLDQRTIAHATGLDVVLGCDVVSLHAELCTQAPWPSHHLLGSRELQRLGSRSLLINASRGSVVDNAALSAQLAGAPSARVVLDVWEGEPRIDVALLQQVALGTAHIAGYSLDGKLLATRMLRDALLAHLGQDEPVGQAASGARIATDMPALRVPAGLAGAALARYLLQARYDIHADDALMRDAMAGSEDASARARAFDALRRTYRERRELAGAVVTGVLPEQEAMVRALGCTPVVGE